MKWEIQCEIKHQRRGTYGHHYAPLFMVLVAQDSPCLLCGWVWSMTYSLGSGEVQPLNIKALNINCLLNGINYCSPTVVEHKQKGSLTDTRQKRWPDCTLIWHLCELDPYSSIQTIIRVTAKKRDQLAPRFGTSVCWTPIAAFKPS